MEGQRYTSTERTDDLGIPRSIVQDWVVVIIATYATRCRLNLASIFHGQAEISRAYACKAPACMVYLVVLQRLMSKGSDGRNTAS